ncbi:outer membrane beta-barrel protein [Leadbetterella sp. DM7]|uniref:outer membrane beta-barrel protein n=1 Tax=Leadbetterella sp. DM7 TaxID=3235085 RepID=UPI00349EC168
MKKIILLLLFTGNVFAQTISGNVINRQNEPVTGATVTLYADSLLVQGKFTDSSGLFRFDQLNADRKYIVKITYIGYKPYRSGPVEASYTFNNLVLEESGETALNEVVVQGRKPMIENEIDRTIVNVEAMPGGNTGSAYSLLEKTPGVNVRDNSVSLNGKSGVAVFINGRPTNLAGRDLENYLKSLAAADIEKIELIDNPPARYDAAGGAIINLKLRQNRNIGWAGSLNASHGTGKYWRNFDGVSLNYNQGKIYTYVSGGYFNETYEEKEWRDTRFLDENVTVSTAIRNLSQSRGFNVHGGLDYFLSDKTTVGVFYRNSRPFSPSERTIVNREAALAYSVINPNEENKTFDGASAYISQKFNGKGRELSLEVNQVRYLMDGTQRFNSSEPFEYVLDTRIRTRSVNIDYVHPIKGGNLEAGMKSSFMNNNNNNRYFDIAESGPVIDWPKTNHFLYKENINAAYVSGSKRFRRWDLKAGIRVETTRAEGLQLGNEAVERSGFERSYVNVFHNFILSYKLDSAGTRVLTFLTQKRLVRPYYLYLNPFMQYRDPYNYATGNPELNPQLQNRYEINFRTGGKYEIAAHYNPFTDVILPTTETIDNKFYTKYDNIAKGYMYMTSVGLHSRLAKWWNVNYTVRATHMGLRGKIYVENLDYSINVARIELNNHFTLARNLTASSYINYASKDLNGQVVTKARYMVNLGFQYKFLKEKASLNVSVDDLFHSWKNRSWSTNVTNAYITSLSYFDSRRVGVSLNYRLGNNKEMKKGKSSNANDDRI